MDMPELRKRSVIRAAVCAAFLLAATVLPAEPALRISGIDSSRLLTRNRIDLYISVTDETGTPIDSLTRESFEVAERDGEHDYREVAITDFQARANVDEGVKFLMLIDNSGSMYFGIDGRRTVEPDERRIAYVRSVLREFLRNVDGERDRVGLASFNTFYTLHTEPSGELEVIDRLIDEIERPVSREAYTEMYAALIELARDAEPLRGRTVVVLLADGENYPFARFSGEEHPEYGDRIFTHREAIEALRERELTVFTVHFGASAHDEYLERIAEETGGLFYNVRTGDDLSAVYDDIRERVLQEYRIRYRPTMEPTERRLVRVRLADDTLGTPGPISDTRSYLAGTLFGLPGPVAPHMLLVPVAVAILLWFVVSRIRLRNRRREASFEVLGGGRTKVFPVSSGRTILGGEDADITVIGPAGTVAEEVTVVYDEKAGAYSLSSPRTVRVNNREVTEKRLEPGDVIRLSGTLVVFDTPQRKSPENG